MFYVNTHHHPNTPPHQDPNTSPHHHSTPSPHLTSPTHHPITTFTSPPPPITTSPYYHTPTHHPTPHNTRSSHYPTTPTTPSPNLNGILAEEALDNLEIVDTFLGHWKNKKKERSEDSKIIVIKMKNLIIGTIRTPCPKI